jgi:predicted nucleic acid-binding protein
MRRLWVLIPVMICTIVMANFLNTNVVVYAFTQESFKTAIAEHLIRQDTIISTQVVFETANVLIKKTQNGKISDFSIA